MPFYSVENVDILIKKLFFISIQWFHQANGFHTVRFNEFD